MHHPFIHSEIKSCLCWTTIDYSKDLKMVVFCGKSMKGHVKVHNLQLLSDESALEAANELLEVVQVNMSDLKSAKAKTVPVQL